MSRTYRYDRFSYGKDPHVRAEIRANDFHYYNRFGFRSADCRKLVYEEELASAKKNTRDGRWHETGHNQFFKELCKKHRRQSDRAYISKVMKTDDYEEDIDWVTDHHGKKFIWSVW